MNKPLVSLEGISLKISGNNILDGISLQIIKKENIAIIGKSGSGKTVLLQLVAGNMSSTSGSIKYHFIDDNGSKINDYHLKIAFVGSRHHFKNLSNTSNFYYQQRYNSSDSEDALTVAQYLNTAAKLGNAAQDYWTFNKTTEALNLVQLLDKEVIKLSNGETKRLMIATALLKNPDLLLLDNPFTGLDIATRAYLNKLLDEISASGITIVMATSGDELPNCIEHILMLKDGKLEQRLSKPEFLKRIEHDQPTLQNIDLLKALIEQPQSVTYNTIVNMTGVNIRYGDKQVLKDINWTINPGERWALLGPNGAGKSTLLSLINGDNPQAYANSITLFDKQRGTGESIWDIKSKIGFVSPELYQYFPTDNSCLQVIESGFYDTLGLFRPSVKGRADLALSWMKALEIDKYARVLLKNIPASAQRLCLLARALIKNPALLIFDEPCQGLDDHQQIHFKAIVDAICGVSNATLIYVTHYHHEIPNSVTKVLKLDKGTIVED
ncbi:ATP-binding cassette domain-containing protein [Mucilaginibacter terrenus]|uniref:ATP-binding cassette domain-containing protein n=1 Tax=Mucilaginibacter terrenus TaxID=2482727 RepID=A0A3E2NTL5_9SPHI|nr:ATP-binding cassette domain-containing protein [Mucilaginibacter terrenus]RFZ84353.1 ATP-binding cassette domain-containing protein [Mucilaginibacter terrenus]